MLNEKNKAKRINMWLLICIARVKAQDLFQNQCAVPLYHLVVKLKCTVLTTQQTLSNLFQTILLKAQKRKMNGKWKNRGKGE